MNERTVYADHSATTGVRSEVLDAMMPYLKMEYGNPSSIYQQGRQAKIAVEHAREQVQKAIGAVSQTEIYFTGCGTESDNWAIKGVYEGYGSRGHRIVTTQVEHHAVLHTCAYLEQERGASVTYLPVDAEGFVRLDALKQALSDKNVILVSVIMANNEIGTIHPVKEIGRLCHEAGVLFHVDAVQAIGQIPVNVEEMNIDLLSLSGHKFYAPKGVGALYVRKGIELPPFMHGGAQERKRRAGTENVSSIVGLGAAIELAAEELDANRAHLIPLREKLIEGMFERVPFMRLNGSRTERLPGHANFSFSYIEGESLLLLLDMAGISASSGSACTSGSLDPSHVLTAIGLDTETARGSLRMTLGRENTEEDVDYILDRVPDIVERLRNMSPRYEEYIHALDAL